MTDDLRPSDPGGTDPNRSVEGACRRCGGPVGVLAYALCPACLLRTAVSPPPPSDISSEHPGGIRIGAFRLIEQIDSGGMGEIFLARQARPDRLVVVKVPAERLAGTARGALFEREVQALAALDHPGIARIHGTETFPDGRPCLVMEFVDGLPITRYAQRHGLGLRERIAVFLEVCDAVQHAHQRGLIHRDLKPANILITSQDGRPAPRLIDFDLAAGFGLPRVPGREETEVAGTPGAMSPEQTLAGSPADTRSDVYGLGAVLYELVAGVPPFPRESFAGKDAGEILRFIRETDPPAPSARASVGRRALRGDLDAIVLKALARKKRDRYAAVSQFAEDLRRHLRHESPLARPGGPALRAGRFLRRHRSATAAFGLVLVLLCGSTVALVAQNRRLARHSATPGESTVAICRMARDRLRSGDAAAAERLLDAARAVAREEGTGPEAAAALEELESSMAAWRAAHAPAARK